MPWAIASVGNVPLPATTASARSSSADSLRPWPWTYSTPSTLRSPFISSVPTWRTISCHGPFTNCSNTSVFWSRYSWTM